jgi:ribulose-5-phosphate 4-epimerase/fuculose-1-phosphate aldolase
MLVRAADGSLDLSVFALAPGSDLVDAGAVPPGELPFDANYYRARPDVGAVELQ